MALFGFWADAQYALGVTSHRSFMVLSNCMLCLLGATDLNNLGIKRFVLPQIWVRLHTEFSPKVLALWVSNVVRPCGCAFGSSVAVFGENVFALDCVVWYLGHVF